MKQIYSAPVCVFLVQIIKVSWKLTQFSSSYITNLEVDQVASEAAATLSKADRLLGASHADTQQELREWLKGHKRSLTTAAAFLYREVADLTNLWPDCFSTLRQQSSFYGLMSATSV